MVAIPYPSRAVGGSLGPALVNAIDALASVNNADRFLEVIDGAVRDVLPHDGLVCGTMADVAEWRPSRMYLHRFPQAYMDAITQENGSYDSEMIRRWRETRYPVLADPRLIEGRWWSAPWMHRAIEFDLTNLAGHGFVDARSPAVSYFCFIRIREPLGEKHVYILDRLVPHLHLALIQSIDELRQARAAPLAAPPVVRLSRRQLETLRWMQHGKTNAEIALIMGTTEANVKYHVKAVFHKLDAHSRTLAVAKAISLGLLE
jgi:transcriptional regulator EpsA